MSAVKSRRKRDSVTNIYNTCKLFNTCPDDVKNKVEHTTIADKILKYGSGAVYFGGLGIGTGSGRGTGGVQVGRGVGSFRPTVPVDTLGPIDTPGVTDPALTDVVTPDVTVQPTDPSVIDLSEVPGVGEAHPTPPIVPELETIPEVDVGGEGNSAVIEVTPEIPWPNRISRTQYNNPAFEVRFTSSSSVGESSASDNIIIEGGGGAYIGDSNASVEELELVPLLRPEQRPAEEQETSFFTSTPESAPVRPARRRFPPFYGRRYEQVPVRTTTFLDQPGKLVTFDFPNPVYDPDVSMIFEQDLANLAEAAPEADFQDIRRLGRPQYSRNREGLVRVSRIGQRGTIQTRSGVRIGSHAHFYYDIEPIEPEDAIIALNQPGEQSGEASLVQPFSADGFELVNLNAETDPVPDEDLLDTFDEVSAVGEDLILHVQTHDEVLDNIDNVLISRRVVRVPGVVYPDLTFTGFEVNAANGHQGSPGDIIPNVTPIVTIDPYSEDFFLHPSLQKRKKRKRKYIYLY